MGNQQGKKEDDTDLTDVAVTPVSSRLDKKKLSTKRSFLLHKMETLVEKKKLEKEKDGALEEKMKAVEKLHKYGTDVEISKASIILQTFDKLRGIEKKLRDLPNLNDPRYQTLFESMADAEIVAIGSQKEQLKIIQSELKAKINSQLLILMYDEAVDEIVQSVPPKGKSSVRKIERAGPQSTLTETQENHHEHEDTLEEKPQPTSAAQSGSKKHSMKKLSSSRSQQHIDLHSESFMSNRMGKKQKKLVEGAVERCINAALNDINSGTQPILDMRRQFLRGKHLALLTTALAVCPSVHYLNVGENHFGKSGVNQIFSLVQTSTSIANLAISRVSMDLDTDYTQFLTLKHLKFLNMSRNELCEEEIERFGKQLRKNNSLETLDLRSNYIGRISPHGMKYVILSLKTNYTLMDLRLRSNGLENHGMKLLGAGLKANHSLVRLQLDRNRIEDKGAVYLANMIKENDTLAILQLHYNEISDEGANALGSALLMNKSITALDLSKNLISDSGVQSLGVALNSDSRIKTLNLSANRIRNTGANHLSNGLKTNTSVTALNLGRNKIGPLGAEALSDALKHNNTLKSLNIKANDIEHIGANAVASSLAKNTCLHSLHIAQNYIGPAGGIALAKCINLNTAMKVLILGNSHDGNHIGRLGGNALLDALKFNTTLQSIHLVNTGINDKQASEIKQVFCRRNRNTENNKRGKKTLSVQPDSSSTVAQPSAKHASSHTKRSMGFDPLDTMESFDGYDSDHGIGNSIDRFSVRAARCKAGMNIERLFEARVELGVTQGEDEGEEDQFFFTESDEEQENGELSDYEDVLRDDESEDSSEAYEDSESDSEDGSRAYGHSFYTPQLQKNTSGDLKMKANYDARQREIDDDSGDESPKDYGEGIITTDRENGVYDEEEKEKEKEEGEEEEEEEKKLQQSEAVDENEGDLVAYSSLDHSEIKADQESIVAKDIQTTDKLEPQVSNVAELNSETSSMILNSDPVLGEQQQQQQQQQTVSDVTDDIPKGDSENDCPPNPPILNPQSPVPVSASVSSLSLEDAEMAKKRSLNENLLADAKDSIIAQSLSKDSATAETETSSRQKSVSPVSGPPKQIKKKLLKGRGNKSVSESTTSSSQSDLIPAASAEDHNDLNLLKAGGAAMIEQVLQDEFHESMSTDSKIKGPSKASIENKNAAGSNKEVVFMEKKVSKIRRGKGEKVSNAKDSSANLEGEPKLPDVLNDEEMTDLDDYLNEST